MTEPNLLVDTSVAVALAVTGHEAHQRVMDATAGQLLGLSGHAWFETFSVLTRLPPPARRGPADVVALLQHNFPESRFLTDQGCRALPELLAASRIAGGATHDALVGFTAAAHRLPLASRDRRAAETYRTVGTTVVFLE